MRFATAEQKFLLLFFKKEGLPPYQNIEPGPPLNGPATWDVIQPP